MEFLKEIYALSNPLEGFILGVASGWLACQKYIVDMYKKNTEEMQNNFNFERQKNAEKIAKLEDRVRQLEEERYNFAINKRGD